MLSGKFLVPSYYKEFKCKCGECKNCCCAGWNITLTLNDYSRLMNLECSQNLRDLINNGVSMFSHATEERYAKIDMNYYGECKLRLENGWCGLQCEVGEDNIPSVCRYYPRGIREYPFKASSISNSCEWVIEYLTKDLNPITFEYLDLDFYINKDENIKIYPKNFSSLQKEIFDLFNSDLSFNEIFNKLAMLLNVNPVRNDMFINNIINELCHVYSHSYSIGDYIKSDNIDVDTYLNEVNQRDNNLNIYIKKILTNHMYFSLFPYVSSDLNLEYSFYGLYFIFLFWIKLIVENKDVSFVDLSANFFRTAEHANMYDIIYNNVRRFK